MSHEDTIAESTALTKNLREQYRELDHQLAEIEATQLAVKKLQKSAPWLKVELGPSELLPPCDPESRVRKGLESQHAVRVEDDKRANPQRHTPAPHWNG